MVQDSGFRVSFLGLRVWDFGFWFSADSHGYSVDAVLWQCSLKLDVSAG